MESSGGRVLATRPISLDELRGSAAAGHLYAVVDACDAPAVTPKVEELGEDRAVCLYRGDAQERYSEIAPYLVHTDPETLDWIVATLWDEPWGIFAVANSNMRIMGRHFRKFLIVEDPDGKKMYFRFYDPRVLPVFLRTCTQSELRELFGPARAYAVTDVESGDAFLMSEGPRSGAG